MTRRAVVRPAVALEAVLPHEATIAGGRWRLAEPCWRDAVERLAMFLAGDQAVEAAETLKRTPARVVVRLPGTAATGRRPVVAKVFLMRSIAQRLFRWRQYGPAEAVNLCEAARRGLPVPAVYGFGLAGIRPSVSRSMVLMEDLAPRRSVLELFGELAGQPARQRAVLQATVDIFVMLYRTACRNIDVNLQSVLLVPDGSLPPRVLDFQHTTFLARPSEALLAHQVAYFGQVAGRHVGPEAVDDWAEQIVARVRLSKPDEWWPLYRRLLTCPVRQRDRVPVPWS